MGSHVTREPLGIDVGGTWIRSGLVDAHGAIHERRRIPTPRGGADALVEALAEVVLSSGDTEVGLGIAGLVSADGEVITSPNLPIDGCALADRLAAATSRDVAIGNDASVAALAEQRFGAGRSVDDLVLITVGTGVGGGVVVGGVLHLGANGFAGEIGHLRVEPGGRRCGCGGHGCLEAYASGSAIARAVGARTTHGDEATTLNAVGDPSTEDVLAAASEGDAVARQILEEAGGWLGVAAALITNLLDPELILLGGGAGTAAAPWLFPAARPVLGRDILGGERRGAPRLDVAVLGDDAGVIGAACLADRHLGAT